ncbi:VOC family protein [Hoeflea sp. YIM 152468]|uniref:VOC family protein n=1 Tax=Hoeflea sp. YIM 152468 TaxID=3031759 RepID=UPI0023DA4864|nr:VOC family protein [Hoeflea sp. YIM 152468]MDF1607175.1 VOC family protein [Hoeflea sp. YIM 152468]
MGKPNGHSRQIITPFLWFDSQAEEAARFYTGLFANSRITHLSHYGEEGREVHGQPAGKVMVAGFELAGQRFSGLNGGPAFKPTPAISLFVQFDTEEEVNALWAGLSDGGAVLMPLDSYGWSTRYGWLNDRYGVSWQIMLRQEQDGGQTITPALMFSEVKYGRAAEAIAHYTGIFPGSATGPVRYRDAAEGEDAATVLFGHLTLFGQEFIIMDAPGSHGFRFTEGVSLMVSCETQAEIDRYWDQLTADGGQASKCGWLKDKFGVSWQITPTIMERLMASNDQATADRLMKAMLTMGKFDITALVAAARG